MSEFKVGDEVFWIVCDVMFHNEKFEFRFKSGVFVEYREKIPVVHPIFTYSKDKVDMSLYQEVFNPIFKSKQEAINAMIARLQELKDV